MLKDALIIKAGTKKGRKTRHEVWLNVQIFFKKMVVEDIDCK